MTSSHRPPPAGRLDRRRFLALSGSVAGVLALGLLPGDDAFAAPSLGADPFTLGIASGDPQPESLVLWTRLAPEPLNGGGMPDRPVPVRWAVATDDGMRRVVRRGVARAVPELAHSVHVEVSGLEPGREYFYQFHVRGEDSPIGRTRTTPADDERVEALRFAFVTCQKWDDGYYSAYHRLAKEDLDVVLHLGDYIYEYGIDPLGGARNVPVPEQFRSETTTLERYRLQYALYKTDPDLQRAHARFPFVVTWDDHEVENDYTDGISENNDPVEAFLHRRAAAYQAFYEHLPLRLPTLPQGPFMPIYRQVTYGDLVAFNVLDTRQYRSDHPCGDGEKPRCDASFDPAQTMTGPEQERWLRRQLNRSTARWNVLAQQVLMAELDHQLGAGEVFWQDSWDGYPIARQRILGHIVDREIGNPIVITGDWHSTFVNDLKLDFKDPNAPVVATEFVTPSISSNGDNIVYGPYYGPMIPENPHIKFFDGDRRGYIRVNVTRKRWRADVRYVTTVSRPDAPIATAASFVVEHGRPGAQPA
jgi:alkaline phosphatase D